MTVPVKGSRIQCECGRQISAAWAGHLVPAARPIVGPKDAAPRMIDSGQLAPCKRRTSRSRPWTKRRSQLPSGHSVVHVDCIVVDFAVTLL